MIKINGKQARICIDAGHGGSDPGAVGLAGLQEAERNLTFAKELMYALELLGIDSELTRSENVAVAMAQRVAAAKDCTAFVSIHCNAAENRSAQGMEVVFSSAKAGLHKALANNINQSLMKFFPTHKNRGLKASPSMEYGRSLYVLVNAPVPACLVEVEFISHPEQEKFLKASETKGQVANALAEGIKAFLMGLQGVTVEPISEAPMCKPLDNQIKSSTVKK